MLTKQDLQNAIEIADKLINESTKDTCSTLFGILNPQHVKALQCLVTFGKEITEVTDIEMLIERLLKDGIIERLDDE